MISHQHKMVFIHVPKAAGQSIENLFLRELGLEWEDRLPLLLGPNSCKNIGPPVLAHLLAREYYEKHFISREVFDSYERFSVVRNPFTRVVSIYTYLRIPTGFEYFVTEFLPKKLWSDSVYFVRPQVDYLYDADGYMLVDNIFRFEQLDSMLEWLRGKLGQPDLKLPHINKSSRQLGLDEIARAALRYGKVEPNSYRRDKALAANRDYNTLFANPQIRETVETLYREDLDAFGYDLP